MVWPNLTKMYRKLNPNGKNARNGKDARHSETLRTVDTARKLGTNNFLHAK